MRYILFVLLFVWELPQHIAALIFYMLFGVKGYKIEKYKACWYIKCHTLAGISLGRFIFLYEAYYNDDVTKRHEWGHSLQSILLGPIYLLIIGFFSMGNNYIWKNSWYGKKSYYMLYPERWADIWGGVKWVNGKRV